MLAGTQFAGLGQAFEYSRLHGAVVQSPEVTERKGLRFYGPDDDLPPGALEALERRTPEELQAAADRANSRS